METTDKMKIVHLCHLYHPSEGGVQFFFKNVSERLVRDYGDDVTVVTTDSLYGPERKIYKKAGVHKESINGVKVIRFPFRRWHIKPYSFLSRASKRLRIKMPEWAILQAYGPYSREMKSYLLNVEADAFCGSSISYYYMQLPLWRKCNFFFYGSMHLEDDETKHALYPTQLKAIKLSTLYLANTTYEKERLEKLGVDRSKVFVLGTGVEMKDFKVENPYVEAFKRSLDIPENGSIVGYVGRIERPKNVRLLVESFALVAEKNADVYLVIAGAANTHVNELKALINKLPQNIASRIKWRTNFSANEKALIFNAIDILVLPSHNESFGIVFLEAWSCKKPVIGTSIGAIRNVITEGEDGLLFNANDKHHLSEQIQGLVSDKTLRSRMGEKGYNKVKDNYTWDIIVARLRQCYLKAQNQPLAVTKLQLECAE